MIVVLKSKAPKEDVKKLCDWLSGTYKVSANPIFGEQTTVIGLVGDTSGINLEQIELNPFVEKVMKVQEPFKRANRKFHPDNTVINIGGNIIGGNKITVIAGPCAVESSDQITSIAKSVKDSGAAFLRGGAFKPRTSPYSFQGLKAEGLKYLVQAKNAAGTPIVSEITNPYHLELFVEHVDIVQVGARNMQNYELLKELGNIRKPVLLKRGFSSTLEELLMSAEYIMSGGNNEVILCERGIRTFETSTRNTLDISAIPYLKRITHLPVIADPSHASGINWMVEPLAMAAISAGADGVIIEVHNDPLRALSDGPQSVTPGQFKELMMRLRTVALAVGREI
ncbi:MAG: 3-deoxy-7-phosphoheptulonate synthase [Christensenellales bacterium]|jgi:3-deoxy-7-phosphoheptulonate synthase